VTPTVLAEIEAHARAAAPAECCGVLLGVRGIATRVLRGRNAEPRSPETAYVLDHSTQLAALDLEIAGEAEVVGYYHSHPTGRPVFSKRDVDLAQDEALYVICSLQGGVAAFAAWRARGRELVEETLDTCEA
jgi:proteasome lid subunit RPN8/RPN11